MSFVSLQKKSAWEKHCDQGNQEIILSDDFFSWLKWLIARRSETSRRKWGKGERFHPFFFFFQRLCFSSLSAGWKGTVMGKREEHKKKHLWIKKKKKKKKKKKNVMESEKCFVFLGGRGGNDCQTKSGKTNVWVERRGGTHVGEKGRGWAGGGELLSAGGAWDRKSVV